MWQKERCDYPVIFPSLIAWEKKSCVYKGKQDLLGYHVATGYKYLKEKKKVAIVNA